MYPVANLMMYATTLPEDPLLFDVEEVRKYWWLLALTVVFGVLVFGGIGLAALGHRGIAEVLVVIGTMGAMVFALVGMALVWWLRRSNRSR